MFTAFASSPRGTLITNWKRWESGRVHPDVEYQRMIASMFGTVSGAMFAEPRSPHAVLTSAVGDADTPDLLARIRASAVDHATLEAMRLTVDRLCSDYPSVPAHQLLIEARSWMHRVGDLLEHRVTLDQHRELLSISGTLALLVGCLEMDAGAGTRAEATRRSALELGTEADDRDVIGWSHEMTAWFGLTRGDYAAVLRAVEAGTEAAGERGVSVQLYAQAAKAWSRIGDRGKVEVALERGRRLLEGLPAPHDPDHHFEVDPTKFDYYAMDVYRKVGEDGRADALADEVLSRVTDWSGRVIAPMRAAEANITKGVVAARADDLEGAVTYGQMALEGDRKSLPSLLMVSQELGETLISRYPRESLTREYVDELRELGETSTP